VPAIVDERTFNTVQALLQSRSPKRVAPRIVNGPTSLAGVARCGYCGAGLVVNTGKGGAYRYYCCSRKMREGAMACQGMRVRMDRLDEIVVDEIAAHILAPGRLNDLLETCTQSSNERAGQIKDRLGQMRHSHKETEAAIKRLLTLVEKGLMDPEDPSLRERLVGLKLQRDELAAEIAELSKRASNCETSITPEKIAKLANLLRDKLHNGPPELKQAYARLVVQQVTVQGKEIRIRGSKAVLARAASNGVGNNPPAVLSFVRGWYAARSECANAYVIEIAL
jgi:hypothetical protein